MNMAWYYKLKETAQSLFDDAKAALFREMNRNAWEDNGAYWNAGVDELLGAILEVPWLWIEEVDSQ